MGSFIPKNPKVEHNKYHGSTRTLGVHPIVPFHQPSGFSITFRCTSDMDSLSIRATDLTFWGFTPGMLGALKDEIFIWYHNVWKTSSLSYITTMVSISIYFLWPWWRQTNVRSNMLRFLKHYIMQRWKHTTPKQLLSFHIWDSCFQSTPKPNLKAILELCWQQYTWQNPISTCVPNIPNSQFPTKPPPVPFSYWFWNLQPAWHLPWS